MAIRQNYERQVKKKWGVELWIVNREYCGKILRVHPGHQCSLHAHPKKAETFYVMAGVGILEIDDQEHALTKGVIADILPGQFHRFINASDNFDLILFEFSTHHEDDDVVRKEESK